MKKTIILLFVLCVVGVSNLTAQERDAKTKLIDGIKKEKLRKPVKLQPLAESEKKNESHTLKKRATDQKVSSIANGNEEGESQICIDPNNTNKLVMSYMDNSSLSGTIQYPVYYSNNGGSSWTKSNFDAYSKLNTDFPGYFFVGGGDPVFTYDKNGALYFSWIYLVVNTNLDTAIAAMYWAKSIDNGATFTLQPGNNHFIGKAFLDPNSVNFDAFPGSEGMYDRQWFAMDFSSGTNANTLYASFIYFNAPSESASLTGSTIKKLLSGGTAFGVKKQAISGAVQFNNVRVDNAGVLHLTGANVDNNSVVYCKSSDGGTTFSSPITVYSGSNLFGSQGAGLIHDRENSAVNMEVDGQKNVHIVWSDFFGSPTSDYSSFYSKLNTGGTAFSTPIDLSTLFISGSKVLMPVVSTNGNKITIGAYVINSSKIGDYYIVNSDNNGSTWSTPLKLSSASTDYTSSSNTSAWFGDYSSAVRTDSKVYNIWSDGRGSGKPKMYVNIATVAPTAIVDITPINSTLQLETIYPNPISSVIHLVFNTQQKDKIKISILTVEGKLLMEQSKEISSGKQTIDVQSASLANGNYIIKITNQEGFEIVRHIQKK